VKAAELEPAHVDDDLAHVCTTARAAFNASTC
jgi:hypothetical protein